MYSGKYVAPKEILGVKVSELGEASRAILEIYNPYLFKTEAEVFNEAMDEIVRSLPDKNASKVNPTRK
ncbi:MAG: hypothetical protein LBU15_00730 [Rickettsiales bacterium]|jgi:hypothetical protein|nr:hypothetical protein [Rickettsiales bacterium]